MAAAKTSTVSMAKAIAKMTNAQLWDACRKFSPSFKSHTAKATADLFTERGFSELTASGTEILNEFFQLSIRVALNTVNISHARDPLAEAGFGEAYDQPLGGITQRIAVNSVKPVSPAYKNLQDGQSVDPYIVRKPTMSERFFDMNFDYQSFITMQDYNLKQIFISEYGVAELTAGVMEGLANGWIIQKYENKLAVINAGINDANLKGTQKVEIDYTTWTDEELKNFILTVMNVITAMTISAQTSAFNSAGFASTQDRGRLKMLVRGGFKNQLKVKTLVGAFNKDELNLDVDIVEVENFGGITYQTQDGAALYIVHDPKTGEAIGLSATEGAETATYKFDSPEVKAVDPNADVYAVLADRGWLFETMQNEYTVQPIHNPRGLYDNYWASAPNNGIHYDRNYNFVVFGKFQDVVEA